MTRVPSDAPAAGPSPRRRARSPACRRALAGLLLVLAAGLASLADARAEPVFPAAGALGLAPPPGMSPSRSFSGFEHRSGASIVLVEMPPEAWDQIRAKFTPEALAASGFKVRGGPESLPVAGGEGVVLRGTQGADGVNYAKWVAVVRGATSTGLVTVQVPEAAARQVPGAAIEATLRSIAFRPKASLAEQIAALPYAVGDVAGFRPSAVFAGNGLLLTEGPKDVDPAREQPVVVVAPSLGQVPVPAGAEVAYARRLLTAQKDLGGVAITGETRSMRGSAVVVRLRATGTDARTKRTFAVTQTVLFEDARTVRVIGLADPVRGDVLDRAERLADSVTPR